MKPIRLSLHARGYLDRRGVTEAEIAEAIRTRPWQAARDGRTEVQHDVPYNSVWNGVLYSTKRVRPIFAEEQTEIVVVTVYTYYF